MLQGDGLRLGFLGFGEAGYEIAKGLKEEDKGIGRMAISHRRTQDPARVAFIKARASEVGAHYCESAREVIEGSDVVLSLVTPEGAEDAAVSAAKWLKPGQVYFDLTSSDPASKVRMAQVIESAGSTFVDGVMMGSLPVFRHKVLIYASGRDASSLAARLNACGMNVHVIGTAPGQAAATKMLVSVATKGFESLLVEMLLGAHHYGVEEKVLAALDEFFKPGLLPVVDRFVGSDAVHARRRVKEMEGAAAMLSSLGVDPVMAEATIRRLRWTASLGLDKYFGGVSPKGYREVVKAWDEIGVFPLRSGKGEKHE